tara:strand:+ start:783 stop:1379 length:597 start_codon:yes stop_codon:yes gene_type:complete
MVTSAESYLLALDVSTFCTGYAIWNLKENKLEVAGHVSLKNKKTLHEKVNLMFEVLDTLNKNTDKIVEVVIEDIITKFISGKSNIKTIITLAAFNAIIQRKCYEMLGKEPTMMNVIRARNLAECKVPRGTKAKDFILRRVIELHPEVKEMLPLMKTKNEFSKEAYDVSDAVVVARARASEIITSESELDPTEQKTLSF